MTTVEQGRSECAGRPESASRLLRLVEQSNLPFGQEISFKMTAGQLIGGRLLIGMDADVLSPASFFRLASEIGMPAGCRELLEPRLPGANAILFGVEERPGSSVWKVYLEFWDQVRAVVRETGAMTPQLLHLGVKWDSARPGRHELARYMCHPMLGFKQICRRIADMYPPGASGAAREDALSIVRLGSTRRPEAPMLYLEVSEEGNPRRSFDVNLYKTGMTVGDAAGVLERAASTLGVDRGELSVQLAPLANCPFGHVAGGIDRHGNEFLSVYAEVHA
jgi:hypothetical protein